MVWTWRCTAPGFTARKAIWVFKMDRGYLRWTCSEKWCATIGFLGYPIWRATLAAKSMLLLRGLILWRGLQGIKVWLWFMALRLYVPCPTRVQVDCYSQENSWVARSVKKRDGFGMFDLNLWRRSQLFTEHATAIRLWTLPLYTNVISIYHMQHNISLSL